MTRKISPIAFGLFVLAALALSGCGTLPMTDSTPPPSVTSGQ
jgi:hypothetical protein